mmetsp:Transcript_10400/g.21741  ORF Transcript_10400/g.21741 Transcript_10400/m.21741 type:complete len:491 (+) Transcript_10400:751-2223(+)
MHSFVSRRIPALTTPRDGIGRTIPPFERGIPIVIITIMTIGIVDAAAAAVGSTHRVRDRSARGIAVSVGGTRALVAVVIIASIAATSRGFAPVPVFVHRRLHPSANVSGQFPIQSPATSLGAFDLVHQFRGLTTTSFARSRRLDDPPGIAHRLGKLVDSHFETGIRPNQQGRFLQGGRFSRKSFSDATTAVVTAEGDGGGASHDGGGEVFVAAVGWGRRGTGGGTIAEAGAGAARAIRGGESEEGAGEVEEDADLEEAGVVFVVFLFVLLFVVLFVALFVVLPNGENDVLIGNALFLEWHSLLVEVGDIVLDRLLVNCARTINHHLSSSSSFLFFFLVLFCSPLLFRLSLHAIHLRHQRPSVPLCDARSAHGDEILGRNDSKRRFVVSHGGSKVFQSEQVVSVGFVEEGQLAELQRRRRQRCIDNEERRLHQFYPVAEAYFSVFRTADVVAVSSESSSLSPTADTTTTTAATANKRQSATTLGGGPSGTH